MLSDYRFDTVLDIGCGEGLHAEVFRKAGKKVTALDYGKSPYALANNHLMDVIIADFLWHDFGEATYDAVWCSHVLEHQANPNLFLLKINSILKEGGVLALTVPPPKHQIVGGHVGLWNAGLLLYHLVLAGFDCSKAVVKKYDYNISVIVEKHSITLADKLVFDSGDITTIRPYLPAAINYQDWVDDIAFDGDIENIGF